MKMQPSPDLLDLAEAVTAGTLRADDAERQLRLALDPDRAAESEQAVHELRGLIGAAGAVRAHARATREAFGSPSPDLAAMVAPTLASIATLVPGRVAGGVVHRRSSNGGDGTGRAPRRTWLLAAAALLLVGGAMAAGSGLVKLPSVVPPVPAPSLAVVPTPSPAEQSSRPIISPSPTSDSAFPARSGMFDDVRAVLLASDTVGWVSTASAVYRTRDMGKTWTEVRPSGLSTMGLVRFLDADTMYVTSTYAGWPSSGGGPVTIAATHDGGASWVEATIDSPRLMAGMGFSFRTPDNGTLTFFTQDGKDLRVFGTTDGGVTWTGPVRSSAPRMLYLLKDLSGERVLVLTNALAPGTPFDNSLNLSMDGGVTWIKRSFPTGDHARAADMKGVAGLWADGSGRIVLAMDIYGDLQIYTSDDNGQSWQFVKDLGRSIGHVQLLSATEWVFLTNAGVLSTVDGGGHWRTTAGVSKIFFYDASFTSPDHGWALLSCHDYPAEGYSLYCGEPTPGTSNNSVVFLATSDGGETWTRIGG